MPILRDLTGQKFGHLLAIERAENRGKAVYWRCVCDCGNIKVAASSGLCSGVARHCGCGLSGRRWSDQQGRTRERAFCIWQGMLDRCNNPANRGYANYGGRGIRVAPEWNDYSAFRQWAAENGYRSDLSIDRIDNDGDYAPGNCRWATPKEQVSNRRCCYYVEVNGERLTYTEAARRRGISQQAFFYRIKSGLSPQEALLKPLR